MHLRTYTQFLNIHPIFSVYKRGQFVWEEWIWGACEAQLSVRLDLGVFHSREFELHVEFHTGREAYT